MSILKNPQKYHISDVYFNTKTNEHYVYGFEDNSVNSPVMQKFKVMSEAESLKSKGKALTKRQMAWVRDVDSADDLDFTERVMESMLDSDADDVIHANKNEERDARGRYGHGSNFDPEAELELEKIRKEAEEDMVQKMNDYEEKFNEEKAIIEKEATTALDSLSQFYIEAGIMTQNEWFKFKLQTQAKGLIHTIFQVRMAERALLKLMQAIEFGTHSARNYEVLNQLLRVNLDMGKELDATFDRIEISMRSIRDELEEIKIAKQDETGEGGTLVYRKKKTLLAEITSFTEEIISTKQVASKNPKLRATQDESEIIEDHTPDSPVQDANVVDDIEEMEGDGFETWEDADDEEDETEK